MHTTISQYATKYLNTEKKLSIVEFAEGSFGLGLKLYPSQKFYLKLLIGEPLNDIEKSIHIKDNFGENILETLTETEYYEYLKLNNRVSCEYQDLLNHQKKVSQYIFCMGRRASKSVMISIFVAYKLYELLLLKCPQEYLNVPHSSKIGIVMVALSQESSSRLFDTFYGLIKNSIFFKKHMKEDPTKTEVRFWTLKDLEQIEKGNASVRSSHSFEVSAVPLTPGVRGSSNVFVVFDEFAHFANSIHSTKDKPMDKFIYEALAPSVSAFRDPEGNPYGKIFIISSPNGKGNMFYSDYETSFEIPINNSYTFSARAPTWEVNPSVDSSYFKKEHYKDISSYSQEYAAEFLDGGTNWIRDFSSLYYCVEKNRDPIDDNCHNLERPYFLGLDFGLSKDGTAMALCHYEPHYRRTKDSFLKETFSYDENLESKLNIDGIVDTGVYIIDYIHYLKPGVKPFENQKILDIELVIQHIEHLFKKFTILLGCYDQWSGAIISTLFDQKGLGKKIEMVSHTQIINDSQYKLFNQLLRTKKLIFPDFPDNALLKELLSLKVELNANSTISVENRKGHDDRFDAICRALYLCYNYNTKPDALSSVISNRRFYDKNVNLIERVPNQIIRASERKWNIKVNGRY